MTPTTTHGNLAESHAVGVGVPSTTSSLLLELLVSGLIHIYYILVFSRLRLVGAAAGLVRCTCPYPCGYLLLWCASGHLQLVVCSDNTRRLG